MRQKCRSGNWSIWWLSFSPQWMSVSRQTTLCFAAASDNINNCFYHTQDIWSTGRYVIGIKMPNMYHSQRVQNIHGNKWGFISNKSSLQSNRIADLIKMYMFKFSTCINDKQKTQNDSSCVFFFFFFFFFFSIGVIYPAVLLERANR